MGEENRVLRHLSRRDFVRNVSLGGFAMLAWGLFRRGIPFSGSQRTVPKDLPGKGSIFQPRNDPRYRA